MNDPLIQNMAKQLVEIENKQQRNITVCWTWNSGVYLINDYHKKQQKHIKITKAIGFCLANQNAIIIRNRKTIWYTKRICLVFQKSLITLKLHVHSTPWNPKNIPINGNEKRNQSILYTTVHFCHEAQSFF